MSTVTQYTRVACITRLGDIVVVVIYLDLSPNLWMKRKTEIIWQYYVIFCLWCRKIFNFTNFFWMWNPLISWNFLPLLILTFRVSDKLTICFNLIEFMFTDTVSNHQQSLIYPHYPHGGGENSTPMPNLRISANSAL